MALDHMLVFGVVEGIITVLLFRYFMKHEPGMVHALNEDRQ